MSRGLIPALLFAFSGILLFSLGSFLAARTASADESEQIAALRAEVGAQKRQRLESAARWKIPSP